jgi:hypothetical protein
MLDKFHNAMELVAELNKSHGVTQRGGKQYTEVAKRVEAFRMTFGGEYGIDTDVIYNDGKTVIVKAVIIDQEGWVVGSGLAEEIRGSSNITKTSAVEVCETSAIGRALASMGLHGGQYASANEMDGVARKQQAMQQAVNVMPSADRIMQSIEFYENGCSASAFEKFEPKYQKLLNSPDITEEQYEQLVNAHNNRKTELGL